MRLIDADALMRSFCNHCDGDEQCTEPCVDIGLIETAPTIDAVPGVSVWCGTEDACRKQNREEKPDDPIRPN